MSQAKRTVVVASPASNRAKRYETDVTTWGELKSVISELLTGDVEAIVKSETMKNVTLGRDDSSLPVEDFRVFLVPTKNKAGVTPNEARQLGTEIGNAIAEAADKASADQLQQLKADLIVTIEDFFGVDLSDDCPECAEALAEAQEFV